MSSAAKRVWCRFTEKAHSTFFGPPSADAEDMLVTAARRDPEVTSRVMQSISLATALTGVFACGACSLFLFLHWDRCSCFSRPVRWWVIVYAVLQAAAVPVRVVLFYSLRCAETSGQSIERLVRSIVSSPAWRVSTTVGQIVYGWLVLGTVWYVQVESCSQCPGMTILLSWILLLSLTRGGLVLLAVRLLLPPLRELPMGRTPSSVAAQDDAKIFALTKEQIDSLPLVEFSCETCSDSFCSGCSICLADFEDKDAVRRLPCGHDFHQNCIDLWLLRNKRCPLCMRGVDDHLGLRKRASTI
jgi:hypothetical protein